MPDTKPGGLYAALARLQKELPRVGKGQTGKVQGENDQGKKYSYEYKYADLADVSAAILPLLGKHGLAFTSRPTLSDGRFVLAYKLTHESGEDESGEYLLPDPQRVKAQTVGSAITYARRYSLCAVTGLAPDSDDDDGHAAQQAAQEDWRSAPVVQRPKHTDAAHERLVESAEDRATHKPAERIKGKAPDDEWTTEVTTDQAWLDEITKEALTFTSDDYGRVLWRRVTEKAAAQGCTQADSDKLRKLLQARHKALEVERQEVPADAS